MIIVTRIGMKGIGVEKKTKTKKNGNGRNGNNRGNHNSNDDRRGPGIRCFVYGGNHFATKCPQ